MNWRTFVPLLGALGFIVLLFTLSYLHPIPIVAPVSITPAASSTEPVLTASSSAAVLPEPEDSISESTAHLVATPSLAPPPPTEDLTRAGSTLLKSIVNIFCLPHTGSKLPGISGSGVIIDSRGLILTAAHVGQYFLLRDYPKSGSMTCTIRTGGPAEDAYTADAVYVSPSWIEKNTETISEKLPKGTGENDFAILAITGSATDIAVPTSFAATPLSSNTPQKGERVAIGAYAAQYLGNAQIENQLYPTIVFDPITSRYTFDTNTVDVISVGGSPAAQEGSSGGGVADANGNLIGLITTSSIKGDVSEHTLNAITPRHIRASFAVDSSVELDSYLTNHSLPDLVQLFSTKAVELRQKLIDANF